MKFIKRSLHFLLRHRFIVLLVIVGGYAVLYFVSLYASPSYWASRHNLVPYDYVQTAISQQRENNGLISGDSFVQMAKDYGSNESMYSDSSPVSNPPPFNPDQTRMIAKDIELSILVKDIVQAVKSIETNVTLSKGFVVNKQIDNPSGAGEATLVLRVPVENADTLVEEIKETGYKVVSEHTSASDITDEFHDVKSRLEVLEKNKARFEEIMASASKTDDILSIQEKIFQLQSEIDTLVGKEQYLQEQSKYSKLYITIRTNDTSLPQSANESWTATGVFNQALHALTQVATGLATLAIWVGVFGIIWIPVLIILIFIRRTIKQKKQ
ncbi:MAG: DUF4349 domain-containing protein [Patescibacteria group bacterium]